MDKGVGVDQADRHFRFWIEDVLMKVGKFTIRICFLWFIHIHGFLIHYNCLTLPHATSLEHLQARQLLAYRDWSHSSSYIRSAATGE